MRLAIAIAALLAVAPGAAAQQPLGQLEHTVGRFDRDTLEPAGPQLRVVEPHAPGVLSPDGRRLALGLSRTASDPSVRGRVGLAIVDPASMRVVHEVATGIAAEVVAFPGVVAALLQSGQLVVVDPASGRILARRRVGYEVGCGVRRAAAYDGGAVFPLIDPGRALRLAVVGRRGSIRVLTLGRLRVRSASRTCSRVGVAIDPSGRRLVAVAGDDVAHVHLRTLRVGYPRVALPRGTCPAGIRCADERSVAWVGGRVALAGALAWWDGSRERRRALGLRLLSAATWRGRRVSTSAESVHAAGRHVLAVGRGVAAYDGAGRRRWRSLAGERAWDVEVTAGRAVVNTAGGMFSLDLATGAVRGRRERTLYSFWFI